MQACSVLSIVHQINLKFSLYVFSINFEKIYSDIIYFYEIFYYYLIILIKLILKD